MNIIILFFIILCLCVVIMITPVLGQARLQKINVECFKKIKIKHLFWLFKETGYGLFSGKSNKQYKQQVGIIFPMFFIQLLGYIVGITSFIVSIFLLFVFPVDYQIIGIIYLSIFLIMWFIDFLTIVLTVFISKKRESKNL